MFADTSGRSLEYACPRCKAGVDRVASAYVCRACDVLYPVIADIPDFRLAAPHDRDLEDDRRTAEQLAKLAETLDFESLLDHYWSTSPLGQHRTLVGNVRRHIATGVPRGRRALDAIEERVPDVVKGGDRTFLELGSGSGGFLVAASERFDHVVGLDIALRWLVMARRQLREHGVTAQLVCAGAEHLPFRPRQVDLVVASDVIEHTAMQSELLAEAHDVLRDQGAFFAATPNRFSLTKEPHVQLYGVGWLPLPLARKFVARVRGVSYDSVFLRSSFGLTRLAHRSPFERASIGLPAFSRDELEGLPPLKRRLITMYNRVKDWPVVRTLLKAVGPVLQLECIRDDAATGAHR